VKKKQESFLYVEVEVKISKRKEEKNTKRTKDIFGGYRVGEHLLPFRTEKLSPTSPMILQQVCGKVGRRQTNTRRSYFSNDLTPFFMSIQ
jgi:hypothetical protein